MWDLAKAELGKLITLNNYNIKEEMYQIRNLRFYLKNQGENNKPKVSLRKIIKLRREIYKIEKQSSDSKKSIFLKILNL